MLVGASMGAVAAARYAMTDPALDGVVLVSCPSRWKCPATCGVVLAAGMTPDTARAGLVVASPAYGLRRSGRTRCRRSGWLPSSSMPVAVVHGRDDRFIACDRRGRALRRRARTPPAHDGAADGARVRTDAIEPVRDAIDWALAVPQPTHPLIPPARSATRGLQFGAGSLYCATMRLQVPQITAPERRRFEDDLGRRMLAQRRVMLTGAIDGKLAERICAQLLVLEAEDPDGADHALPPLPRR